MRIDYRQRISEGEEELLALEQQLRGRRTAVRVQVLRLLKSGQVRSLEAAAPLVGYSSRQLQKWWRQYRTGGIGAVLEMKPQLGRQSRMTDEAYAALSEEMIAGRIATLKDARRYLGEEQGIEYRSLNGVWRQLRKRGAKLKTGRRRHRRADEEKQEAFKKTLGASSLSGK